MSINKSSKDDIKYAEQIIDKNTLGDEKRKYKETVITQRLSITRKVFVGQT